jgi:hypothetical protein
VKRVPVDPVADDIDPELVRLRRRPKVGPILALSILGLSGYVFHFLRADFGYAGRSEQATQIEPAALAAHDNEYVSLPAALDVRAPARLWGREGRGHRLAPAIGTDRGLWIHEDKDAYGSTPPDDGRFVGRLRRLADVPFGPALAQYVAGLPPQPHTVFPEALAAGVPAADVAGAPLALTPETRVAVDEKSDIAVITLVQTDSVFDEATARKALESAGLTPPEAPVETTLSSWTYELPGDAAAFRAKLRAARIFGASCDPKLLRREGLRRDLTVAGGAVTLAGQSVPMARLSRVTFLLPEAVPADAWVLLAGETPAAFWYVRPLGVALLVLDALMLWALVASFRRARPRKL